MRPLPLLGVAAVGLLSACDLNFVPYPKKDVVYVVAPNRVTCSFASYGNEACLLIKRDQDTVWREFDPYQLKGFSHEQGFRYRLIVAEGFLPPSNTYELKQILEKTPDDSIAVPGQP